MKTKLRKMKENEKDVEIKALSWKEWFGQMERISDERLTKRIYRSDMNEVRRRGRPRKRWRAGIG